MSDTVQFRLAGNDHPLILVPVGVNGAGPFQFVLDTGAGMCLLAPEMASRLGIGILGEKLAMGAGGPVKVSLARAASLAIGEVPVENVDVAITTELERIGSVIGARVDGVIGFNFLKAFRVTLHYREQALRLLRSPDGVEEGSAAGTSSMAFTLAAPAKPLVMVTAFLEGQGPFAFAVDTGASTTMLAPGVARQVGLQTKQVAGPVTGGGGQFQISAGRVRRVMVGSAEVSNHAAGVGEFVDMLSAALGTRLDGILGHNFLNQFVVTIDYPRSVLELAPGSHQMAA